MRKQNFFVNKKAFVPIKNLGLPILLCGDLNGFNKRNFAKIENPLVFASRDNFKNLPHIKDLGKTILNLLSLLKSALTSIADADFLLQAEELLTIFSDYDWQKLELKKTKLKKQFLHWIN